MLRTTFWVFALAVASILFSTTPLAAQLPLPPLLPKVVPDLPSYGKFSKTPDIIQRLQTEIPTDELQTGKTARKMVELLEEISDQLALKKKDVAFIIDEPAFRAEIPPSKEKLYALAPETMKPEPSVSETKIKLPLLPKKMTAATALSVLLGQVPKQQATYLIRQNTVVITTTKRAAIKNLLQEKVAAAFYQKPLFEALYTLSDQTGASIVIDPRVTEQAWLPVSATFGNDATLHSALTLLTEMVGLRPVVLGDGIYITTPENADRLRYQPKY
jgi:hypothetical protein